MWDIVSTGTIYAKAHATHQLKQRHIRQRFAKSSAGKQVGVSIVAWEGAFPVSYAIPEFTNIFVLIDPDIGTLSVSFAIPEFTNIFVSFKSPCLKVEISKAIVPSLSLLH